MFGPKTLYQKHLEEDGFVHTRAIDLDEAIKALHYAVCAIDNSNGQAKALKNLLNKSVRDLITEFGTIEELRHDF